MSSFFRLFIFVSLILTGSLLASGLPEPHALENREPTYSGSSLYEEPAISQNEQILVDDIVGLILVASPELVVPSPNPCQGVVCLGLQVPGGNEELIARLTPLCIHRPLTHRCIDELKREIILYYREQNHPLVMVFIPEQTVNHGVFQLVVIEACLGKVIVTGNCFSPEEYFIQRVRVDDFGHIDERILLEDVSWMNTNPFRRVNMLYTPGEFNGTTDIELHVVERRPWRIYAGADNTGTPSLGQQRIFAGCNFANVFFPDTIFSYQYTASPEFHKFQSHTFQLAMPFCWRDTLSLFGGYATANPTFGLFHTEAKTSQISGRYTMPQWWARGCYLAQCDLDVGYDFKSTNSNLFFGEDNLPVTSKIVWINQFVFGLQLAHSGTTHRVQAGAECFWSPGQITSHQTEEDFNSLRPGATANYFYGKLSYSHEMILPFCCAAWAQARLQLANANLLASEQFSLGGFNTVRGYDERIVNGDNAFCLNLELRTLPICMLSSIFSCPDSLVFLGFFDLGHGWDHEQIPGFPKAQTLMGVGLGMRYHIGPCFSTRVDYGFALHNVQDESNHGHLHFSLIFNY